MEWDCAIEPPAATAIRKVTEGRDQFESERGCRHAWEREVSRLGLSRTLLRLLEEVIFPGYTAGVSPCSVYASTLALGL